jgi:hypothetical protein
MRFAMKRTKVRSVNLDKLFPSHSRRLNAHVARLTVLYEFLRLELRGTSETDSLKQLEKTGYDFRKFYFMCRAIGTAWEFAEEFLLINKFEPFKDIKDQFSGAHRRQWDECQKFFEREEPRLKRIRNDIGGHFGFPASLYAVQNLENAGKGLFEFHIDLGKNSSGVCFRFAEQLLAAAMSRQKREAETAQQFFERTFTFLNDAFHHAVRSTDLVAVYYVVPVTRA